MKLKSIYLKRLLNSFMVRNTCAVSTILTCMALYFSRCANPPEYSDIPAIEFLSLSKNQMSQTPFGADTVAITFSFTDGDGDISFNDSTGNIFIVDARDNFSKPSYRIPKIDEQGVGNGISGTITIWVPNTCCIYPPDTMLPCDTSSTVPQTYDTLAYRIRIMDRAKNMSNEIEAGPIFLRCKK